MLRVSGRRASCWSLRFLLVCTGRSLTRILILAIFIGIGATAGRLVADRLGLPVQPTAIFLGAMGGIFSFILYRYALGLVLALVVAAACGAWSAGGTLNQRELSDILKGVKAVPEAVAAPGQSPPRMGRSPMRRGWKGSRNG